MNVEPQNHSKALVHAESRVARAHAYFVQQVREWLNSDEAGQASRAESLVGVITRGLQLVAIDLRNDENSQEIFETLNARGTPLTAADLIKNFVFQRLTAEGVDTHRAYKEDWAFDTAYWEKELSVGRYFQSRSSVFLAQWLGSRVGEEISPRTTFTRFKHYVEHESVLNMAELLREIHRQAEQYRDWTERASHKTDDLDPVTLSVYRMRALDSELLKPLLIWLHEEPCDAGVVDGVVATAESWVVRRSLLRLPSSDMGRIVADLISTHRGVPDAELAASVERFFADQQGASTYWPGDDEIRQYLRTEPVFRRFRRARLRMYLEAVEDHARGYPDRPMAGGRVARKDFHIEHVLPQKWDRHWPVTDLADQLERQDHVHRLGNLTLLTGRLNASVSNGPWAGPTGKRQKLDTHDVFLMNRAIRQEANWDEDSIDQRAEAMIDALLSTWPVPEGHSGQIAGAQPEEADLSLARLVALGLLSPGTQLTARTGAWGSVQATVTPEGTLELGNQIYSSPSGAARAVRGSAANGWGFWRLPDGRRLGQLRRSESQSASVHTGAPSPDGVPDFVVRIGGEVAATGRPRSGFTVTAGSRARRYTDSEAASSYRDLQQELIARGQLVEGPNELLVFVYDFEFASASAAASVVLGRSSNGRKEWRIRGTEQSLGDWQASLPN